jgi:DNA replication protein DnaD
MMDIGSKEKGMDTEFRHGLMVQCIKASGSIINPQVKANSCILMEMFMKDNGQMIKPMDMEFISTLMEPNTLGNGRMTCNMD